MMQNLPEQADHIGAFAVGQGAYVIRHESVFIDTSVPNFPKLIVDLRPGMEVVLLDSDQDGLSRMLTCEESHAGYFCCG